jgi:CheY-like chemotaxis protein
MTGRVPIVLLIEHDAIQRGTVARLLKAAGCCVIPVGRAHEALETFAMHHVDIALVVADTQTTSLSGPPLLGALARIDPTVPVVALSAGIAVERPAYEYPNVAATLMRPFKPADVVVRVERVLQGGRDAFEWPPTEEQLADIQVVDTRTWQGVQTALGTPAAPAGTQALVKPSSAPLVAVALPERRSRLWRHRLSARTRRSVAVAATACCGLALTTLLELRGTPTRQASLMDETTRDNASLPVLRAHDHRIEAMTLVSARRVMPRAMADVIPPRRPSATPPAAKPLDTTRVTKATSTSTAGAVAKRDATPPPSLALPPPTAASPLEGIATRELPAPERARDVERDIYQVLEQYERAYERLDVNAARAVWPSLNTRALARAFDGLKAQALEFSHCRVAMAARDSEATAVCGGRASYVPRVGRQAERTEPREWTFHLRKIDRDWLIDKAEVR